MLPILKRVYSLDFVSWGGVIFDPPLPPEDI